MTVDAWGGFSSQGKNELAFYQSTLDAPASQDILKNSLLPKAKEWFGDEKGGNSNKIRRLVTRQSPPRTGWSSMGLRGWPTKGDDINLIENLWAILDERLEDKKFKTQRKE